MNWLVHLLSSHNFWSTITGALIGGLFALLIARRQVISSEKNQEIQRKEVSKHEKRMELIRIQLTECKKSIAFLSDLFIAVDEIELNSYESSVEDNENEILRKEWKQIKIITDSLFKIVDLKSSAKICELSDNIVNKCDKLTTVLNDIFDSNSPEGMKKLVEESKNVDHYKQIKLSQLIEFNDLINLLNNEFTIRNEELIYDLKRNMS